MARGSPFCWRYFPCLAIKQAGICQLVYVQMESTEESNEHKDNVRHVDTAQTVNEDVEYQTQISSMVSKPIIRINRAIGGGGGLETRPASLPS